jgi:hypothetical protein
MYRMRRINRDAFKGKNPYLNVVCAFSCSKPNFLLRAAGAAAGDYITVHSNNGQGGEGKRGHGKQALPWKDRKRDYSISHKKAWFMTLGRNGMPTLLPKDPLMISRPTGKCTRGTMTLRGLR